MDRRRESFEGDGQQRRKKTARRRRMQFLSCVCCLILLVAVMYGGLTLYSLYRDRAQETGSEQVNSIGLDENGNVVDGTKRWRRRPRRPRSRAARRCWMPSGRR